MNETSLPRAERRQTPRTKLAEITYIGMGPENGGLVLDVSDGGLSFHSVAPVQPTETIRFLLSLQGQSRIEGIGEVVWTNEMRTVCGMKFTSLSSGAREHLHNWVHPSATPEPPRTTMQLAAETPSIETPTAPPVEEPRRSRGSEPELKYEPLFAIAPAENGYPSEPAARSLWGGQLFLWVLFALMGAAVIGGAFLYGVHVGQLEINPALRTKAPPASPTQSSVPASPAAPAPENEITATPSGSNPASSVATTPLNATPSVPSGAAGNASKAGEAAANPSLSSTAGGSTAATLDARAEQAVQAGKSQLAAARAYLNGTSGLRDSAKAARQLWAAVGNGNSDAEEILAGLYLVGDGVPKSCEQGRVLLIAAVKSGNTAARTKLDELNAKGCP